MTAILDLLERNKNSAYKTPLRAEEIDAIYRRMVILEASNAGLEAENFVLHRALHETGQFQHYVFTVGDRVSVWMQPGGQNQFTLQGTVTRSQWDDFLGKVKTP